MTPPQAGTGSDPASGGVCRNVERVPWSKIEVVYNGVEIPLSLDPANSIRDELGDFAQARSTRGGVEGAEARRNTKRKKAEGGEGAEKRPFPGELRPRRPPRPAR
jgi:hypothetical protein